jgi:hypothetical protein
MSTQLDTIKEIDAIITYLENSVKRPDDKFFSSQRDIVASLITDLINKEVLNGRLDELELLAPTRGEFIPYSTDTFGAGIRYYNDLITERITALKKALINKGE